MAADTASWERLACDLVYATRYKYTGNLTNVLKKMSHSMMTVNNQYNTVAGVYDTLSIYQSNTISPHEIIV
jgi:hypothetical protein